MIHHSISSLLFFFNDTATTEIYTLSLHDALPISAQGQARYRPACRRPPRPGAGFQGDRQETHRASLPRRSAATAVGRDRKSTRLNSSHGYISYAVFCLKKKKKQKNNRQHCTNIST